MRWADCGAHFSASQCTLIAAPISSRPGAVAAFFLREARLRRAAEGGALSTARSAAERDTSSGSGAHGVLLRGAGLGLRLFFGVLRVDTMLLVRQQAR